MKNDNKKTLMLSIVAVALIAVLVSGGTYAYWTWSSNNAQKTNVNFTVQGGDKTATLTGNASSSIVGIIPSKCDNSTNAIVKTVPIAWTNNSSNDATVTATLNITSFSIRSASYVPTATNLESLKWAVRSSAVASSATSNCNPSGNETAQAACNACSTDAVASGDFSGLTMPSSGTSVTSGLPLKLTDLTFTAGASSSGTQTYYLYIWLDANYTHNNSGSTNSDPMQGLSFMVQWSGTMV